MRWTAAYHVPGVFPVVLPVSTESRPTPECCAPQLPMPRIAQIRVSHYPDIDQDHGFPVHVFLIQLKDVAVRPLQILPAFPLSADLLSAFPSSAMLPSQVWLIAVSCFWTVEVLVETAAGKRRESLFRFFYKRYRHLLVGAGEQCAWHLFSKDKSNHPR